MSRETDLAWAAGIVDGEGYIGTYLAHTRTGSCYVLKLTVVNTDIRMLERFKLIFGVGSISSKKVYASNHKPRWDYYVSSKKAQQVLELIQPYLVAKADQAELALLSRKYIRQHGINTANLEMDAQADISRQLKALH